MDLFEQILNEVLGNSFRCKAQRDGVDIISSSSDYAMVIGFLFYPGVVQVRDRFIAMKRFPEVEGIITQILKRHKIQFTSYGGYHATIQTGIAFEDVAGLKRDVFANRKDILLNDAHQIREVVLEFQKAIEYAEKNFILRYPTLQAAFKHSETMTPKERGEFFAPPAPIRKIVVEALCAENFDFELRFNEYIEEFTKAEMYHPSLFKNYAKITKEISERLKGNGSRIMDD
jgi:hypothetical protein